MHKWFQSCYPRLKLYNQSHKYIFYHYKLLNLADFNECTDRALLRIFEHKTCTSANLCTNGFKHVIQGSSCIFTILYTYSTTKSSSILIILTNAQFVHFCTSLNAKRALVRICAQMVLDILSGAPIAYSKPYMQILPQKTHKSD